MRDATEPAEVRGTGRDDVRLLVASPGSMTHARFRDLGDHLRPGDLLVVNTSGTLAAALDAQRPDGRPVAVHVAALLDDGAWVVEVRPPGAATGPVTDATRGERIALPVGATLTLDRPYSGRRLWRAKVAVEAEPAAYLERHGRPIRYAYIPQQWPLAAYQTVFAREPGSAEMPSAARPFTTELVTDLVTRGVAIAPITLHCGVSSPEDGEPPMPERYDVPESTAALVAHTRRQRRRVIAVGTTVTRALETVARGNGRAGWTRLVLGPDDPAKVVDGIVTGWHAEAASHLRLLESVVGAEMVKAAYDEAEAHDYLRHEFGDAALLLRQ